MNVLMLTCGTGGGHNSACAAVAEALKARGHAVTTLNPYTLKNDQVAEVVDKAYILLAQKAPNAFGAAYKLGDVYRNLPFPSPVYRLNRLMEPLLENYIEKNGFDAVVTTHLFPAEMLTSMKRRGRVKMPRAGASTGCVYGPWASRSGRLFASGRTGRPYGRGWVWTRTGRSSWRPGAASARGASARW